MNIVVTGAAGFIGSNLIDELLSNGHQVVGVDNFSTGKKQFLSKALTKDNFTLIHRDLFNERLGAEELDNADIVYHLAANADIRGGLENPSRDLEQNILVTFNVLEAMRHYNVKKIIFASSAAALGQPIQIPTNEECAIPDQTSLYGASKMSCEGLISAYCAGYGFNGSAFRFVSILGPRYPHGHVFDFVKKLHEDNSNLEILGDGSQRKSYLHINDCIRAIIDIPLKVEGEGTYQVFHLGTEQYLTVSQSAEIIATRMGLLPNYNFTGGKQGWIGDNPFVFLDISKAKKFGWTPLNTIHTSVCDTVDWLLENKWIFDE